MLHRLFYSYNPFYFFDFNNYSYSFDLFKQARLFRVLHLLSWLLILSFVNHSAFAEGMIESLKTDPRAKVVGFNPNQIYAIKTHYLVSTDIILGDDETVNPSDIHLGDASAWDVEASGNHLYIKAKKLDAGGNLNVTSNQYTYHFILSVSDAPIDSSDQTLFLKFAYPTHGADEKKLALEMATLPIDICANRQKYNLQYSFTGSKEQVPIKACDDGLFTYLQFRKHTDLPAIFMVLPDRGEEVVNYRMEGSYMVVERVAKAFTLRNGTLVTSVYNDKYIGDWDAVHRKEGIRKKQGGKRKIGKNENQKRSKLA